MKPEKLAAWGLGIATVIALLLVFLNSLVFGFGIAALLAIYSLTLVNFKKSGHRIRGKERMILVAAAFYLLSIVLFRIDNSWTATGIDANQNSALFVFESIIYLAAIVSSAIAAFMPSSVSEAIDNNIGKGKGVKLNYDFNN
jgi:hypothetical protein